MSKEFLKGSLYLTVAKVFFLLASYTIYIGLAHILEPAQFGVYGVVVGLISILNMALITGTVQAVSKFVAGEAMEIQEAVKKTTLKIQAFLAGGFFLLYFVLTPQIARLLKDPALTNDLRIASAIFLSYAFYAVFIGYLNGKKEFRKQALFDISYSVLKLILILGFAALGFGARGALSGFAISSLIILIAAVLRVGFVPSAGNFDWVRIFGFEIAIIGLAFVTNLTMNLDLLTLKALSPVHEGSLNAGLYTAAATIARVPYQLLAGVNLAVFPLVAGAIASGRFEEANDQIRLGLRIVLGVTLLAAVGIASSAKATAQLIYPQAYSQAAQPLTVLAFAYLFFSLWVFVGTILAASGHPRKTLVLGVTTVGVQFLLLLGLVPRYGGAGAAGASLLSWLGGVLAGSFMIERKIGKLIPLNSLLKIIFSGFICYLISSFWHAEKALLLVKDGLLAVLYLTLLVLLKEITLGDWERLRKLNA